MKTIIFGSDGQLGRELMKVFHGATGFSHNQVNVVNTKEIHAAIGSARPETIINTSAFTNVDKCEEEKQTAFDVNGTAVKNLVNVSRKYGSYFVHVSTDYVFDGAIGDYDEKSVPNPINYYGLSKLVGDIYANSYDNSLIIRTSGVFGHSNNFPLFAFNALKEGKKISVIDGYYSPIHAKNLSNAIKTLTEMHHKGIINVAGERTSRLKLSREIAELFDLDEKLISIADDTSNFKAKRPFDSSLNINKAKQLIPWDFYSLKKNLMILNGNQ